MSNRRRWNVHAYLAITNLGVRLPDESLVEASIQPLNRRS